MGQVSQNLVGKRVKEARETHNHHSRRRDFPRNWPSSAFRLTGLALRILKMGVRGVLDFEIVALAKSLAVKVTWLLGVKE